MSKQVNEPAEAKGWREVAEEYGVSVATLRKWLSKQDWQLLIEAGYIPYSGYILKPKVISKMREILGEPEKRSVFS